MTRPRIFFSSLSLILASLVLLPGCQRQDAEPAAEKAVVTPASSPDNAPHTPKATAIPKPGKIHGKVIDIIEAAGYTYIRIDTGSDKLWAAGPSTAFNKGDMVAFDTGMPMKDFHSKSLDRTFNLLYFVDAFDTDTGPAQPRMPEPHSKVESSPQSSPIANISKANGGQTIAEIISGKDALADKPVKVRGKVVKFTAAVLGKNWIHIKDSSTGADLTVTTDANANNGDIVLIEGKLGRNKDFGYGYLYDVIVEDAKVTVE